jgi:hypothetical protein
MSNAKTKLVLGGSIFTAWAVVACTAGVGTPPDIGQAYGDKPGSFGTSDKPGSSTVASGGEGTAAGDKGKGSSGSSGSSAASDTPSNNGSGGSSSSSPTPATPEVPKDEAAGCAPCDATVTCEVTITGQGTTKSPLPLKTKNGACTLTSGAQDIVFVCGGGLTLSGQSIGSWKNCVVGGG